MITILIVDDDSTLQIALARRLRSHGYDVISAASGAEALNLLGDRSVDVVVSDILMPEMSGFEFCRKLRERPNGQLVPFIFLSSLGELNDRVQGYELGADDYLVKPFHSQELLAKIQAALARSERLKNAMQQVAKEGLEGGAQEPEPLPLSPAEEKVFWEVVQGFTNKEIADNLYISPRTVQTHLSRIMTKLGFTNRSQIVRFAFEHGYTQPGVGIGQSG
jgi:DNA-binding NarL/FixJ family response regulator